MTPREKVRAVKEYLGMSLSQMDDALGYHKKARTAAHIRKKDGSDPSPEYLVGLIDLVRARKGIELKFDFFFDGGDANFEQYEVVMQAAETPDAELRFGIYRGKLPAPEAAANEHLKAMNCVADFTIPSDPEFWQYSDDSLSPFIGKGDHVMVDVTTITRHGALALVVHDGWLDLYWTERVQGETHYRPVSDKQAPIESQSTQRGVVVQVTTKPESDARISVESANGITESLLKKINRS